MIGPQSDSRDVIQIRAEKRERNKTRNVQPRSGSKYAAGQIHSSLPIPLLLAGLVRIRVCIEPALRIAEVTLRALARGLLSLLGLRHARRARAEPLCGVEASLRRLLHATAALRDLPNASLAHTNTNAGAYVLQTSVVAVRFVGVIRRRAGTLAERRTGRGTSRLAKAHEALHSLTGAVQRLVLAVVVRRKSAANTLSVRVLRVVRVADVLVCVARVLLSVQALSVRRLRLNSAWGLLRGRRRRRLGSRRALEDGRVLDERLGDGVAGIVGRAVVLVLRVAVVVRQRRRVALRRPLARACLALRRTLRRRRDLLGRLRVSRWEARSTVRLLLGSRQTLDLVVTAQDVPVAETTRR